MDQFNIAIRVTDQLITIGPVRVELPPVSSMPRVALLTTVLPPWPGSRSMRSTHQRIVSEV